jgi:hypothetical protein
MDDELLAEARRAQERLIDAERDAEVARAEFHRAVRRLHLHGASLREIAASLGLSHQRVHQIVESAGGSRRWLRRREGEQPPLRLVCTFCGRNQAQVKKLIAGPGVYICNRCTDLTRRVISSGETATTAVGQVNAVSEQTLRARCSFCGKYRPQVPGMAAIPVVVPGKTSAFAGICTECLDLCDEIITEELT